MSRRAAGVQPSDCLSRAPPQAQARCAGRSLHSRGLTGPRGSGFGLSMVFAAQRRPAGRLWSAKTLVAKSGIGLAVSSRSDRSAAKERVLTRLTATGRCGRRRPSGVSVTAPSATGPPLSNSAGGSGIATAFAKRSPSWRRHSNFLQALEIATLQAWRPCSGADAGRRRAAGSSIWKRKAV